jgi:NhaP-type Na+/H+ or K+/H+ antiporter
MSRSDRIIGIVLGLLIGVVAVILFVFAGDGGSVDSPSLQGADSAVSTPAPGDGQEPAG